MQAHLLDRCIAVEFAGTDKPSGSIAGRATPDSLYFKACTQLGKRIFLVGRAAKPNIPSQSTPSKEM